MEVSALTARRPRMIWPIRLAGIFSPLANRFTLKPASIAPEQFQVVARESTRVVEDLRRVNTNGNTDASCRQARSGGRGVRLLTEGL